MIRVRLYGLLRLESGIAGLELQARDLRELFRALEAAGLSPRALAGCLVLVNGKTAGRRCRLEDGDLVQLLPPVAGG